MRCNVPARRRGSTKRPSKRQLRQLRKRAAVMGPGTMPGSIVSMIARSIPRDTTDDQICLSCGLIEAGALQWCSLIAPRCGVLRFHQVHRQSCEPTRCS